MNGVRSHSLSGDSMHTDCTGSCKSNYHTITTHWPVWVCDVLLTKFVCWLMDVPLPSMVNGCSIHHVGYWIFCRPWWFLDALFIVVVGRFDKHKQKNRLKQSFTTKLIHHVGMLAIGCCVGHDGYWMSYWHWWFLDTLFIVVIGRFDTHKQKKPVKNKTLRHNSWFKFYHWNFAFICNNIPAASAFGIQLLCWYGIPGLMDPIRVSVIDGCCQQSGYWTTYS
jgi:hypothetical protein